MNFKEYFYLLKEDPDTAIFYLDDSKHYLKWNDFNAKPFGFINPDSYYEDNGKPTKFFTDINLQPDLLIGPNRSAHFEMLKDLVKKLKTGKVAVIDSYEERKFILDLSKEDQKIKFFLNPIRYKLAVNSRNAFMPCGRIWTNIKINNKELKPRSNNCSTTS